MLIVRNPNSNFNQRKRITHIENKALDHDWKKDK